MNDDYIPMQTAFSMVQFGNIFIQVSDATKLYMLHHELQHQLNGDVDNRSFKALFNNECPLANIKKTAYVQAILKSNVKNSQGHNLQDLLNRNSRILKNELSRYKEFRADINAVQNIQCPHCITEASLYIPLNSGYESDGYINRWQCQPQIDQLTKQSTICQHHHENGEQIDTSVCDGSTLTKRMIIVQKNK
jgi:hypothetical protein